ncbi:hypothetical protein KA005_74275 [bacterium]|nr:hypothetical protein [bacterium]
MNRHQKMVLEFHRKMGFTINDVPTIISEIQIKDRSEITREELGEIDEAFKLKNMVKLCDAITDTLYAVYGTAVACGIDIEPIFAEIHRSNMTKTPPNRSTGKAIKGEEYSPPDIESLIKHRKRST